ncbi:MAG: BamA/TamA family outer membrane protein [Balneolales bacterium]
MVHLLFCRLAAFIFFIIVCVFEAGYSQTFFETSGRNHPELDWVVSETEHFKIIYPSHLDNIQNHAAAIAEETYSVLSENLNMELPDKIRIYLTDQDEITNGFAVPLGNPYVNIWVHVNDYANTWTGKEKWLRKVISHELAHVFHYELIKSNISPFDYLLANPLPRFWAEGFAQYQTELWDARRGDRWLRIAAFEDRLDYKDGLSAWNGALMYALGNSQVRYFAEQYGDSSLVKLLKHRKSSLFGLARVHDFNSAFRASIGKSYNEFYEEWEKHISVYYNSLAGQMDRLDSLKSDPVTLPATWFQDIKYSPDTTQIAVLGLVSLDRPVNGIFTISNDSLQKRRLIAMGSINAPISWHPSGDRITYSRTTRGGGGSIVNDLYVANYLSGEIERLTHNKRARSPVYSSDGKQLAFIHSQGSTDNITVMNMESGEEQPITFFEGDIQLLSIQWHPDDRSMLISRFTEDGTRDIILLDIDTHKITTLTSGEHDDRDPVWIANGSSIAYTSLRDQVENVYMMDVGNTSEPRRVTHLFTGISIRDWLMPDSLHQEGRLVIQGTETKRNDSAFLIDATPMGPAPGVNVPNNYATWTEHRPPNEIPKTVTPDHNLIQEQYPYPSFRNLTHGLTLAGPYYAGNLLGEYEYGIAAGTAWIEPVGMHMLLVGGGISFTDILDKSFFYISYTNNQFRPSLRFDMYKRKPSAGSYGLDLLLQERDGGGVTITQPLDWFDTPYLSSDVQLRIRYTRRRIYNAHDFLDVPSDYPEPEAGEQADLRFTYTMKRQLPSRSNVIQQKDGWGLRLRLTGAIPGPFTDSSYFRPDLAAYSIFPGLGSARFYIYIRALGMYGDPFPQDIIGFTRSDYITVPFNDPIGLFELPENERVRGYREFLIGDQLLFSTLEYRVPFVNLRTQLLGIAVLGQTSISSFLDAGSLRNIQNNGDRSYRNQLGTGIELKNILQIGGVRILHSLGIAQPVNTLGFDEDYDLFYRIRASVPF